MMLSENEVLERYKSKLKLYAKSGLEKFLYEATVLQEILEISNKDAELIFIEVTENNRKS